MMIKERANKHGVCNYGKIIGLERERELPVWVGGACERRKWRREIFGEQRG